MSTEISVASSLPGPEMMGAELMADINACVVPPRHCAFWWLGQHSFVVKLSKTVLYVDPFLSPVEDRRVPPLLRPEQVTNASLIFGSHDHGDHIDRAVWPTLAAASPQALFIVPELLRDSIIHEVGLPCKRMVGVDPRFGVTVRGVRISAVPAAHELLNPDPATGLYPCVGFVIQANGCTIYHAGDTCIYEGMQAILRQWRFDLATLPINGRDARRLASNCIGNMTYQEAVDLAGTLRPGMVIPAHFEMFDTNSQNPQPFVDYLHVKYPDVRGQIPVHGRRYLLAATY